MAIIGASITGLRPLFYRHERSLSMGIPKFSNDSSQGDINESKRSRSHAPRPGPYSERVIAHTDSMELLRVAPANGGSAYSVTREAHAREVQLDTPPDGASTASVDIGQGSIQVKIDK